ncbi:hypothetical protein J6590_085065 [Homalodisca vitripennis]|nr:hypothetical protein J6590_085065 [Homalodisca vitripennis]
MVVLLFVCNGSLIFHTNTLWTVEEIGGQLEEILEQEKGGWRFKGREVVFARIKASLVRVTEEAIPKSRGIEERLQRWRRGKTEERRVCGREKAVCGRNQESKPRLLEEKERVFLGGVQKEDESMTTSIEKTAGEFLNTLLSDDIEEDDDENHREIRARINKEYCGIPIELNTKDNRKKEVLEGPRPRLNTGRNGEGVPRESWERQSRKEQTDRCRARNCQEDGSSAISKCFNLE